MQSILYKDGEEFLRNDPKPITTGKIDALDGIPILQRLTLGSDMPPGRYTLQLLAADKKGRESVNKLEDVNRKESMFARILRAYLNEDPKRELKGVAAQTLSFTVVEKSE